MDRPPLQPPFSVVRIDDYSAFLALREEWNRLAGSRSVFLRHEWFDAAWQWRKHETQSRLALHCVRQGARLAGVLPTILRRERFSGLSFDVLELLTVPDNQMCDIIAADGERGAIAAALAASLVQRRNEWDLLRFAYLPTGAIALAEFAHAAGQSGLHPTVLDGGGNAFIALDTTWDAYYAGRSRSLKKANNLAANRLKKAGAIDIRWLEPGGGDPALTAPALGTAIDISSRSWKKATGNSLDHPGPNAFIRRLTELAAAEGWLSLWLLALNDRPMAMEYQLVFEGDVHALRADFDEACVEISPGSYLNRHLLEQLFGRKLRRYFMGPGDNAYKARWTDTSEPLHKLHAYSPSLKGRLAALIERQLKPLARRWRDRLSTTTEKDRNSA